MPAQVRTLLAAKFFGFNHLRDIYFIMKLFVLGYFYYISISTINTFISKLDDLSYSFRQNVAKQLLRKISIILSTKSTNNKK